MEWTICQAILDVKKRNPSQVAVRYVRRGQWVSKTWQDYYATVEKISAGLRSLGVTTGDKVAIWSNTRPEWAYTDMAVLACGGITVPIYQNNTESDIEFIMNNSETKFLFCEDPSLVDRWLRVASQCPTVRQVICFDRNQTPNQMIMDLDDLIKKGEDYIRIHPAYLEKSINSLNEKDIATIVYTSGTTGQPKGVVLTHGQITSEVQEVFPLLGITDQDTSLTFLPFAHILGRAEHWGHISLGFCMGYAENVDRIRNNLIDIKPTFMVAVPRIFEKVYNSVISQAEASPIKKKIFDWSMSIGTQVSHHKIKKEAIPFTTLAQYRVAQKLVFNKLAQKMGGRLRFALSGGAPLSKEIGEFFHAANILILEGYGLTETTAAVFVNTPFDYRFGTVGKSIGEVKVKIANDGEILIKSKKVMDGYYRNREATSEVLHDGWFATGDIGELSEDGFLRITDRKKDLIKTSGGKYVAPQKLENLLKLNKYISNVLIHGDQKKYIVALVTLNFPEVEKWATDNGISYKDLTNLAQHPKTRDLIFSAVSEANSRLASFESIKNFGILNKDFTIESGELTPSLKVKRKYCDQKYSDAIEKIYGRDQEATL